MGEKRIRELTVSAAVVGSGAAGYNAVHRLRQYGVNDAVLITENQNAGTSRNAGSDKQTYYKLSLSGSQDDSVRRLAGVLYDGGCVDGDHALCEAALSAQSFFKLLELGVPFPHSRYGEFVGYKTDHDPNDRGTSAGPYTSRYMTEALENAVKQAGIAVYKHCQVIRILTRDAHVSGVLCLDTAEGGYVIIWCRNLIYATGGPAGIYSDSVYPVSQLGASGLAFEAGVKGKNLTEWQYGLASLQPRWNVSGSYMQVLPRMVSTDQDGGDEQEFLLEYFKSREQMQDMIFLKGYQWPFDVTKAADGSSVIDLLVYRERNQRGRRVWLDYRKNAEDRPVRWDRLSEETVHYLKQADACQDTPYERLRALNQPAVDFYREHGVDLSAQMLEIAVCAQHNNGGLAVDAWWQTNIQGFFAAGEVAGTHGITRPGGSALNAGQAGAARAAEYIGVRYRHVGRMTDILALEDDRREGLKQAAECLYLGDVLYRREKNPDTCWTLADAWERASRAMSGNAALMRDVCRMRDMSREIGEELEELKREVKRQSEENACLDVTADFCGENWSKEKTEMMSRLYRYYDMRICQKVYLDAMADYYGHGGRSRGSAIYPEDEGSVTIPGLVSFSVDGVKGRGHAGVVQEIAYDRKTGRCQCSWRPVRKLEEIPEERSFERVWKQYMNEN